VADVVRVLDSDLDIDGRVTLTITLGGSLSIQTFRESGRGFYRLQGAVILPAEMIREWAETLYLVTRPEPAKTRTRSCGGKNTGPSAVRTTEATAI
jgi:hypothetical protein